MQLHFLFCVIPSQIMIMMKDTWSMVNTQCEVMKFWFHTNGWMFMFCIGKISHTVAPVGWLAVAAWTFLANHKNQCHDLSTLQCKCKNSIHTPLNKVIILSDNYWLSLPVCSFTVWTWLPPSDKQLSDEAKNLHITNTVLNKPMILHCSLENLQPFLWIKKPSYQAC